MFAPVVWRLIETAPKDGTLVLLLVDYTDHHADHPLENALVARTIGFNNFDNDGEDIWKFAGWCWEHDHFVEGKGQPIRWQAIAEIPQSLATSEAPRTQDTGVEHR